MRAGYRYNDRMALIPVVGRRSWRTRITIALLYLALSLGAITMVYPFLLMIGQSLESNLEQGSLAIVPAYIYDNDALFNKYAEAKYSDDMVKLNGAYSTSFIKLQDVHPPRNVDPARLADWATFRLSLPARFSVPGFAPAAAAYSPSALLDRYHVWLRARFHDNIHALDREYTEEDDSFLTVFPPYEDPTKHTWTLEHNAKADDWIAFSRELPANFVNVIGSDAPFRVWLKEEAGYPQISQLNKVWGKRYNDFSEIPLTQLPEGNFQQRKDWETFVRTQLNFRLVRVAPAAASSYRMYISQLYNGEIPRYNRAYNSELKSFADLTLPDRDKINPSSQRLLDWVNFIAKPVPLSDLSVDSAETRYRTHLTTAIGYSDARALTTSLPIAASDWVYVKNHASSLRREFMTQNYDIVLQYIVLHGRGLLNTTIFVLLSILTALLVNPLAAYALSRYNLSYGNMVLIFVLSTMAFPAEVAIIPNFLLLKQLGLLNTFAALILPTAASGYSILLLKGFFDSLPKELYEAAMMDGASEMRMFFQITLPVAKPIFAVIALQAFIISYGSFMFALLVCQNPRLWTLMVWLYELQSAGAPQYVMLAALSLAAIPTLVVFSFAQRTIMRGIILPSFK